jgi:hypothetical protein
MTSETFFNLNDFKTKNKCKECKNVTGYKYNNRIVYYCKITYDGKTQNNLKKIKLKNLACNKYEKILKILEVL